MWVTPFLMVTWYENRGFIGCTVANKTSYLPPPIVPPMLMTLTAGGGALKVSW